MFHNFFFLKRLAAELSKKVSNLPLAACFSQNKDELILTFTDDRKTFYIRANLDPNVSLLAFPTDFARAGKNSVDLFEDLIEKKVIDVQVFDFERSFQIRFENQESLIFKMHARRANILHARQNKIVDIFRKTLASDWDLDPQSLHKRIEVSPEKLNEYNGDPNALIPALGKEMKAYFEEIKYWELKEGDQWPVINEVLQKLDSNPIYLHESGAISLLAASASSTTSAIDAANWLYNTVTRNFYFIREKNQAIQKLKQQIKKSENYISKTESKLNQVLHTRSPEEIANILMANLNSLQKGLSKAMLHDFYTNQPIEIKLNKTLTPQKNAETLYRKSKNRHQEIDQLKENIQAKHKLIDKLSRQALHIESLENFKELRTYLKTNGLADGKEPKSNKTKPYHEYFIEGWVILLGKNAKANDELTLKIATKNDLWLHAKDVAGSHVVIKQKPGQNFPNHIIERAAALAAAHSKRKNDTLCPVIYTQKKFVRKVKGTPAGQVLVEREEVVMVEPSANLEVD